MDIFNLSRILKENTGTSNLVQSLSQNDDYLPHSVSILREMSDSIFDSQIKLYTSVYEATSAKEENCKFADYFKEYKDTIDLYIGKMKELFGQFSVNIETFADANSDIVTSSDVNGIKDCVDFKGIVYDNLLNDEIPKIDPYKAFKKEFALIGKLLQDLGPVVDDKQKTQVIATVCNNLNKEINDGWLKKVMGKIADTDDSDGVDQFAKVIYRKFVKDPSKQFEIDLGTVKQAKFSIVNYKQYINCVRKSVDEYCDGLAKVSEEIGNMVFRNQDNKLPIKTDVEGVEDKTYRLGDYSMNQVNIFVTTKISQITELCNLYLIAMGIKMDCIYKYLLQCKDIIDAACDGVDNTPNDTNDTTPDVEIPEGGETPSEPKDDDFDVDDDDEDPVEPNNGIDDSSFDIDDDNYTGDGFDGDDTNLSGETDAPTDDSESEIEQECYLFEATLLREERYMQANAIKNVINIINEDNLSGGTPKAGIKSKAQAILNIIKKFLSLVKNMVTSVRFAKQIKYVADNRKTIQNATIPEGWTIQRVNMKYFNESSLQAVPFDPNDESLDAKTTDIDFYLKHYPQFFGNPDKYKGQKSLTKAMLITLSEDKETPYTTKDRDEGLTFVTSNYDEMMNAVKKVSDSIKKFGDTIEKASYQAGHGPAVGGANNQATEESATLESTMFRYFTEDNTNGGEAPTNGSDQSNGGGNGNNQHGNSGNNGGNNQNDTMTEVAYKREQAYVDYMTKLSVTYVNVGIIVMRKHMKFLLKLAKLNGAPDAPAEEKDNQNNNNGGGDQNNNQNNNQQ